MKNLVDEINILFEGYYDNNWQAEDSNYLWTEVIKAIIKDRRRMITRIKKYLPADEGNNRIVYRILEGEA